MTHHYAAVKRPSISGVISDSTLSEIDRRSAVSTAYGIESTDEVTDKYQSETVIKNDNEHNQFDIPTASNTVSGQLPAQGLEHYLQEQEKKLIITALKQTGWNKTQAAELLGTTFRSLRYRMTKLDIAEDQSE